MNNPILKYISVTRKISNKNKILKLSNEKYLSTLVNRNSSKLISTSENNKSQRKFSSIELEKHVIRSPYSDINITGDNVATYVWKNINKWPNHIALVCGITGRSYTYMEARDRSAAFGSRLRTVLKLKPGETVALAMPNMPEFAITILGAAEAGLVVTTVNPGYKEGEITKQLIDSDTKCIITSSDNYNTVKAALTLLKSQIPVIVMDVCGKSSVPDGAINFLEFSEPKNVDYSVLKDHGRAGNDVAFLPYSSGTTGLPKGVELSHNNITSNCSMVQLKEDPIIEDTTASFQDVVPVVLPMFHIYGLVANMASKLALGCKLVTLPNFSPDTFLSSLEKYKGTVLHLVPPIVLFMSAHPSVDHRHLGSTRVVMSGAAPLAASDVERFKLKAPKCDFIQGYGLTETSPVVLVGDRNSENYASVGRPTPNTQAKIVSLETGENVGPDQEGELLIRGPQVMLGYRNNPKATKNVMKGDWLCTGDMAYYDETGTFYITDRLKELIKVKGFQVPPAELEGLLRNHPALRDAAVVGLPHPISGEVPLAFVVRKPDANVTEEEIKEHIAKRVASYKQLAGGVRFIETIPKNAAGKIMRRELKAMYL